MLKSDFSSLQKPTFSDVSVHDPGIIKVGNEFYVFGSHLAVAKSKDLMNWEQVASNAFGIHPIFGDTQKKFKDCLEWAESKTFWAPDMIRLKNGKFLFYYNACRGDAPKSALGIAIADNIKGPYENLGLILKSDMVDELSHDGTVYDGRVHPNVVDPHTFFCKEDKLWMMYGSFSGGIFILEMNPETGFPFEGQGYGKKMLGGNHLEIEGPYVIYAPEADFYYLFSTYGRLNPDGGYNMRIMRSKNPDGPYTDASGFEMINAVGPDGSMFDRKTCAKHGSVIMRNHKFADSGIAFLSPGHNSVFRCEDTGRYFIIFHVRFSGLGFHDHQVRVHEIYLNEDVWFVASPHRYSNRQLQNYKVSDLIGNYDFIEHGREISAEISYSKLISLNEDLSLAGIDGSWGYNPEKRFIDLIIEDVVYKGVVSHQWNEAIGRFVLTFTAMGNNGVSVWGSKTE